METIDEMLKSDLTDKVALITGGAQRVGAMTARLLHAAGANLVLHYRSSRQQALDLQSELNALRKNSVIPVQADLLETIKLKAIIKSCIEQWGRLDILINNASSFYPTPIGKVSESDWDDLIGSNMKAPFFLSRQRHPIWNNKKVVLSALLIFMPSDLWKGIVSIIWPKQA